jgi:hypothetical protein
VPLYRKDSPSSRQALKKAVQQMPVPVIRILRPRSALGIWIAGLAGSFLDLPFAGEAEEPAVEQPFDIRGQLAQPAASESLQQVPPVWSGYAMPLALAKSVKEAKSRRVAYARNRRGPWSYQKAACHQLSNSAAGERESGRRSYDGLHSRRNNA